MKWKRAAAALFIFIAVLGGILLARAVSVPATVTTTPAVSVLVENAYRWYGNIDNLTPTTALAAENTSFTAPSTGTQLRLRMNIKNTGGAAFSAGNAFILQYANASSGPWTAVSTSTAWTFFDNPAVADGQIIVTTLLASSTIGESYGESNPSAAMPTQLLSGDFGEWDWVLVNNSASSSLNWLFRMIEASGTALDGYSNYPKLAAAPPSSPPPPVSGGTTSPVVGSGGGGSYLPVAPPLLPPAFQVADFNGDNRIDIVDLSILLYYYGRSDPVALRYDLNRDGLVDFPDVSILMYYWTG